MVKNRKHTKETREKISRSNTGKIFSEERKRNIGLSRQRKIPKNIIEEIKKLWSLRYVNECFIMEKYNFGKKVYDRLKKEHCTQKQIKFLPKDMTINEIEFLIEKSKNNVPYSDIAKLLNRNKKQIKNIILKLSKFYDIKPIPKTKGNHSKEHKNYLKNKMISYNKENPKFGKENGNWRGGVTEIRRQIYSLKKYKNWRLEVFKRDNFKCSICNSKKNIEVDHLYPFALILHKENITSIAEAKKCSKLWDIENGRTLCKKCHKKTETHSMKLYKQILKFNFTNKKEEL